MSDDVVDLVGALRESVARARERRLSETVAPTTDRGNQAADEGVYGVGSPPGVEPGQVNASARPNSPSAVVGPVGAAATASAGPYTQAEFEALIEAVWSLDDSDDLVRFHELLHAALVFLGRVAFVPLDSQWGWSAVDLLRSMELRATLGPDWPVIQP